MDCSQHIVTKNLNDRKMHAAIISKLFKRLNHVNNAIYKVELAKAEIEHKQPFTVVFLIFLYTKLWLLELYYNFFTKLSDVNNFEELELETDSLYLAPAVRELEDCIRPKLKTEWERLWSSNYTDSSTADAVEIFSPKVLWQAQKYDKRKPGLFKEEFRCTELICLGIKT